MCFEAPTPCVGKAECVAFGWAFDMSAPEGVASTFLRFQEHSVHLFVDSKVWGTKLGAFLILNT